MKVILPTYEGDIDQAINLAKLIKTLGGTKRHSYRAFVGSQTPTSKVRKLEEALEDISDDVKITTLSIKESARDMEPTNALHVPRYNEVIREILTTLVSEGNSLPFLLLEPDSTPTKAGWLEALEEEYQQRRSEGFLILAGANPVRSYIFNPNIPERTRKRVSVVDSEIETYFPGSPAIYPAEIAKVASLILTCIYEEWDVKARFQIAKVTATSSLIAHAIDSKNFDLSPDGEFTYEKAEDDKTSTKPISAKSVMIIHGCKDETLAKLITTPKKENKSAENNLEEPKAKKDPRQAALESRSRG